MTHYIKPREGSEFERSTLTEYNHDYYKKRVEADAADYAERAAASRAYFAQKAVGEADKAKDGELDRLRRIILDMGCAY